MRKLLYFPVLILALACTSAPDAGELAAVAAKGCYDLLIEGKYDDYVAGRYTPDSIPDSYREQLVTNAKMFVGQQQDEHRGIKEVRIVNAKADTARHTAQVFLVFSYGDSTSEEVMVPMVEHRGVWKMK